MNVSIGFTPTQPPPSKGGGVFRFPPLVGGIEGGEKGADGKVSQTSVQVSVRRLFLAET